MDINVPPPLIILLWINKSLLRQVLRRVHRTSITNTIYELVSMLHLSTMEEQKFRWANMVSISYWCVPHDSPCSTVTAQSMSHSAWNHPAWIRHQAGGHPKCLSGSHSILSACKQTTQIIHSSNHIGIITITNTYKVGNSIVKNLGHHKHGVLVQYPVAGYTRARHRVCTTQVFKCIWKNRGLWSLAHLSQNLKIHVIMR